MLVVVFYLVMLRDAWCCVVLRGAAWCCVVLRGAACYELWCSHTSSVPLGEERREVRTG